MHNFYLFTAYGLGFSVLLLLFGLSWRYHKKYFVIFMGLLAFESHAMMEGKPENKGCPNYSVERCKLSLKDVTEVVSKCSFIESKNCAIIFMESLNTLDERAPFYSSLFDGFMKQGNIESYRKVYEKLSDDDRDVLFSLSAALAIEVRNHFRKIGLIDADGEDEINDAVSLPYQKDMKRPFEKARPRHEKQFINQARKYAQFITWPKEVKNIQYGIRDKIRKMRKKRNADPNDPTPEFGKEDYAEFMESSSASVMR